MNPVSANLKQIFTEQCVNLGEQCSEIERNAAVLKEQKNQLTDLKHQISNNEAYLVEAQKQVKIKDKTGDSDKFIKLAQKKSYLGRRSKISKEKAWRSNCLS